MSGFEAGERLLWITLSFFAGAGSALFGVLIAFRMMRREIDSPRIEQDEVE